MLIEQEDPAPLEEGGREVSKEIPTNTNVALSLCTRCRSCYRTNPFGDPTISRSETQDGASSYHIAPCTAIMFWSLLSERPR